MERKARQLGLVPVALLISLAIPTSVPVSAEEPVHREEPEPERLLEGLAPLAKHGPWKSEREDDLSPESMEPPPELPEAHRAAYGHGIERITRHAYSIEPERGWSRGINLTVFRFASAPLATAFREAQRAYWSENLGTPLARGHVRTLSLAPGSGAGFALEATLDSGMSDTMSLAGQLVQQGRTVLAVVLVNCDHIRPETATAFIEYAFGRTVDPDLEAPPAPSFELPLRQVALAVESSEGETIGSVDLVWRREAGGAFGERRRVGGQSSLTLPAAPIQVRVGHARSPAGAPLPLLRSDIRIDATAKQATCRLPEAGTIRVRVQDPEGQPVAGASVQTLSRAAPRMSIGVILMGEQLPEDEEIPEEIGDGLGTTDASGWVTLPLHRTEPSLLIVRGGKRVLPTQHRIAPDTSERVVVVEPAWTLEGVVTDQSGRALACRGAVRVGDRRRFLETDAEGAFVLGPIARRSVWVDLGPVHGWDGRFDEAWREIEPTTEPLRLSIPCRQIDLRVEGPDGKPVPRCQLRVALPYSSGGSQYTEAITRIAVPLVECRVEASEPSDAAELPLNLRPASTVVGVDTTSVTLRLNVGRKIRGLVLDPEGRPVQGAEVRPWVAGIPTMRSATTDAAGRFEVVGLGERPVTLKVDPPAPLAPTLLRDVAPGEGEEDLEVRLPEAVPITVEDEAGNPVPHAYVALWAGPGARELCFEAHTDDAGRVYFPRQGMHQEIAVQMQNGEPLAAARRVWDGPPLTIRLPPAFTARVLVLDANGPVAGAEVEIEDVRCLPEPTGPEGYAVVRYVPVGSGRARARRRGGGQPWSPWVTVREEPGVTRIRLPEDDR